MAKTLNLLNSVTKLPLILMKSYLTPDMPPRAMAVTQAELGTFVIVLHVVPNSVLTGRVGFQFE